MPMSARPIVVLMAVPTPPPFSGPEIVGQMLVRSGLGPGFQVTEQVVADRWSAFFARRPHEGKSMMRVMRAICALMPYRLVERTGNAGLLRYPFQQLAMLAVPD